MFIVFVLVFGAALLVAYDHNSTVVRSTINENRAMAKLLSTLVYEHQRAAVGVLESCAQRPGFMKAAEKRDFAGVLPYLQLLNQNHGELDAIFVADREGVLWANYPVDRQGFGKNLAGRDWYKGVSRTWQPYISSAFRLIVLEKGLAVAVSVPISNGQGEITGILSSAQRTGFLAALIRPNSIDPKKRITIIEQEGNIIYSDSVEYEKEITPYPYFEAIQHALRSGSHFLAVHGRSKTGGDLVAFSPVSGMGWTVIVGEKRRTPVMSEPSYFAGIMAIALLLFLCLTGALFILHRELRHSKTKETLVAERRLRESEEIFRVLAETTPTSIMLYQNDKWVYANPAAEQVSGYSLNELLTMDFWAFVHPDYRDFVKAQGRRRQEGDTSIKKRYEFTIISKDGQEKWVDLSGGSAMLGGSPAGIISVDDITERKKADEKIALQTKQMMLAQQMAKIGYWSYDVARQQPVWSEMVFTIFGRDPADGVPCYEDHRTFIHSDDWERFDTAVQGAINGVPYAITIRVVFPDGSIHHVITQGYPQTRSDGTIPSLFGTSQDITERKEVEEKLLREHSRLQMLLENAPFGIMLITNKGFVAYLNPKFTKLLGYAGSDIPDGKTWFRKAFPDPDYRSGVLASWLADLKVTPPGNERTGVYRVTCRDGAEKIVYFVSVQLESGEHLVSLEDRTELYRYQEDLAFLSVHDALTGLLNRRALDDSLGRAVAKAKRGVTSSFLYVDLDRFKEVNDTAGHHAGDRVLVDLAQVLRKTLRTEDVLFRLGGDEFGILLDGIDGPEAQIVAQRLCVIIASHPCETDKGSFFLGLSIGLAEINGLDTVDELLSKADTAMYQAKTGGGGRIVVAE